MGTPPWKARSFASRPRCAAPPSSPRSVPTTGPSAAGLAALAAPRRDVHPGQPRAAQRTGRPGRHDHPQVRRRPADRAGGHRHPGLRPGAAAGRRAGRGEELALASTWPPRSPGTSQLIVQGTAGTTEEQIKYSWNYALLIAEGPSRRALVESPILRGMQRGQLVRFEELTRCAAEVQDALISILSEKQVVIPELDEVGAGAARIRRDRHREHPRPGRQRDERRAQAALQLRHDPGASQTSSRRRRSSSGAAGSCCATWVPKRRCRATWSCCSPRSSPSCGGARRSTGRRR